MKRFAGPALLFLLSVCFCWKLVLTNEYTWLESPDLAYQVLPWLQFQAGEWRQGHIPLWDPNHWMGQPLIGQAQPGVMNPLNWVLLAVPLKHGWIRQSALHWYFLLLHFLPALFMYLLCRDLRLSRWASILGGLVFAFGGFVASNDWPQMLSGAVWLPLVILFLLRSARGERPIRSAALSGLFLGLSWLSGHHQVPLFITLTVCFIWFYLNLRTRLCDRRLAAAAAVCFSVMFLVSAIQTLPAYEYGRNARRWAGVPDPLGWNQAVPYIVHEQYSLKPQMLVGAVVPGVYSHAQAYAGAIAVGFAFLGLWVWKSKLSVQVAAAVSLAGLLLAIGASTFVHGVLYSVIPLVEKARSPAMAIVLFNFGIALLCSWGAEAYLNRSEPAALRRMAYGLAAYATISFLLTATMLIANVPLSNDRIIASALLSVSAAAMVLWNSERSRPASLWVIGLLICCELSLMFGALLPSRFEKERNPYLAPMAQLADVVEFLRSRPQPVRVYVDGTAVPFNFGDWYGVEQLQGYLASLTNNTAALEYMSPKTHQLLGVNYVVAKEPLRADQELLFTSASGLKVFSNPGAFDRVRLIHHLTKAHSTDEIHAYNINENNDLSRYAPLLGDLPALDTCTGAEDATLIRHRSNDDVILVDAACRGMVVLADTNFPGWRATVDGKAARMYEPYGVLRGVVVEKGSHRIEMTYRPASVVWGAICSLLGLMLVAAIHLAAPRFRALG